MAVSSPTVPVAYGVPRVDCFGHSGPVGGTTGGIGNSYPRLFAKALGAKKYAINQGGGSAACWPTAGASTDGGWSWVLNTFTPPNSGDGQGGYPPLTTVVVAHHGGEDLAAVGSQNLKAYREAYRTELSRYCSAALFPDTDGSWAFTGAGWAAVAPGTNWIYSGGGMHYSSTVGSVATWTTPADYPGNLVCAIGLAVINGALGTNGQLTLGLKVDGVPQPDVVIGTDKGGFADTENGKTNGIVLRIGRADCGLAIALAKGQHTIELTYKATSGGGGNNFFVVNYAQIEADPLDGPLIVAPSGMWRVPSYSLFNSWAHGPLAAVDPMNDAAVLALIAAQRQVLADFPGRSLYVDVDGIINKQASMLADGLHMANHAHALVAQACYDALGSSGLLTSRVLAHTADRALGETNGGYWRSIGGIYGAGNMKPFTNTWAAFSTTTNRPMYCRDMQDRMHLRGQVKQAGAGGAASIMFAMDTGDRPWSFADCSCINYTGAAFVAGAMRADIPTAGTPGQTFCVFNGQTAAGSLNELNGTTWSAEA